MSKENSLSELEELNRMGIPVSHDLEREIKAYFSKAIQAKKNSLGEKEKNTDPSTKLIEVKVFGFKDGNLQHNMPCPVCMSKPATYINDNDYSYFGPCTKCYTKGFRMATPAENRREKEEEGTFKKWWRAWV
jgi:uncharacterized protein YukJ